MAYFKRAEFWHRTGGWKRTYGAASEALPPTLRAGRAVSAFCPWAGVGRSRRSPSRESSRRGGGSRPPISGSWRCYEPNRSRPFAFGGARCLACCPRHEPPMLRPVEPRVGLYLLPCVPLVFTSPSRRVVGIRKPFGVQSTTLPPASLRHYIRKSHSDGNRIHSALSHRTEPPRSRQRAHYTSAGKRG